MPTGRPPFHTETKFACENCVNYECTPIAPPCIHWSWCGNNDYRLYEPDLRTRIKNIINKLRGGRQHV